MRVRYDAATNPNGAPPFSSDVAIDSLQSAADFRRIAETEAGARRARGTHAGSDAVRESREGGLVSLVIADVDGKRARAEAT
jgi:hypothetical protein